MSEIYEAWAPLIAKWKAWQKRRRINVSRAASRSRVARRVVAQKRARFGAAWARIFGGAS